MIDITRDRAIELMEECVADRGADYVYPQGKSRDCMYVDNVEDWVFNEETDEYDVIRNPESEWRPGCIVGMALIKAGVPMQTFVDLEINEGVGVELIISKLHNEGIHITPQAEDVFSRAQGLQDQHHPWGNAVASARTINQ